MTDANTVALASVIAGTSVAALSGLLQYRSTRAVQRQDRLLSYESRIADRRISTYLEVLVAIHPIKTWCEKYKANWISVLPSFQIEQHQLVQLTAFGSREVTNTVAGITQTVSLMRSLTEPLRPLFDLILHQAKGEEFDMNLEEYEMKLDDFVSEVPRLAPDQRASWTQFRSALDAMVETASWQITDLEQQFRSEIQAAPTEDTTRLLQTLRALRRMKRASRAVQKIAEPSHRQAVDESEDK
jgi:hypothetical protein